MPKTAVSRLWEITRHVLSIRGLLQWTGWWQPVSAIVLSQILGAGSASKGIPWPLSVLIGLITLVIMLILWRAFVPSQKEAQQQTPNGLRQCASALSGSLFSLLVEVGEKLDAPMPRTEDIFREPPPADPTITRLISDQGIDKRIKEVFVYAQDLGLLSGMCADVPQNVPEVRSKITELWYLVKAIKH